MYQAGALGDDELIGAVAVEIVKAAARLARTAEVLGEAGKEVGVVGEEGTLAELAADLAARAVGAGDELERVGTVCLGVRVLQILLYLCVCVYVCDMWLLCVLGAETRRYLSTCSVCAGAWSARIRLLRA